MVMVNKGVDCKGIETERKDKLPFVKLILKDVLSALLVEGDVGRALAAFGGHMDALVEERVPMEMLTLRKNLSSKVENKTDQIAHAKVNALKGQREPGSRRRPTSRWST